jgi:PfaD family protein
MAGASGPYAWRPDRCVPSFTVDEIADLAGKVREPLYVVSRAGGSEIGVAVDRNGNTAAADGDIQVIGMLPPLYPEWLGDPGFRAAHGVRFPYVAGEMANGIATVQLVSAMAESGMLGFFGAAGLSLARVEQAVSELCAAHGDQCCWGVNLIHSPQDPRHEMATAELLLSRRVRRVSASAFMRLTPAVVRCAITGLRRGPDGRVVRPVHVFAKVSHPDVATEFLSPAPAAVVDELVAAGHIDAEAARLARLVPVADDVTVEADSGGHTDSRPLSAILPTILSLRDKLVARFGYHRPIRVAAAGGLGTPDAVAGAFALGAAYVVTGSVNQAAVESGICEAAREMLAEATVADSAMAACADTFELGVEVQVLSRGTMFAARANRLYDIYRQHRSIDDVPAATLTFLERDVFRSSAGEVWDRTRRFWLDRDSAQVTRAERDPQHKMALMFRWYLGMSSRWSIDGEPSRRLDYQVWCGPAMGAFNEWTAGSFLAEPGNRSAVQIARNLLEGAAVVTRAHQLRSYGVPVPAAAFRYHPRVLG